MSSSNYLQRSLHHYNSSPCLTNTTRLLSSYATNNNSVGPKQIITPKPVKASPAFCKPSSNLKTNPPKSNFSSPSLDTSPTSPVDVLGGQFKNIVENGSSPNIISGTPERLANEELHKILFSHPLSASRDDSLPQSPQPADNKQEEKPYDLPISPFSPFISHSPFPTRTFSPPTIELDINESLLIDDELNFTDDVILEDSYDEQDQPRSVPSTFGYDDEDFHSLRNDQRKRRNFVTQEDISFLIELRTRPKDNGRFPDEVEYHRSSCHSKVEDGYFGAEMGLLSFSPPTSRILNY
ncbi:hypothetical protein NAEGRDRAFT_56592 [Naegleria gruberi]|uniref:Uncharacterized protein n=1 Tax=Naegleria gruberi TaxID=5762 RepID=D2UZ13_NAEGR|nr:uncharacterized protein NAEGRDRAFT_56592 [Naegleria gruberi]EFC50071.1 hypothetical protein NAEGRDRAFT_56592 [Naegleria gruberi]|eukprot:XP_002682815.1 hypothetical protein NAEGRDRAFT_56592 [Naegleria gruberi strain NEG-M]